jgi:hypothetical protein
VDAAGLPVGSWRTSRLGRAGVGAALGGAIGLVGALAAVAANVITPDQYGTLGAHLIEFDPTLIAVEAPAGAAVGGALCIDLTPPWPFCAVFAMTLCTLAVALAVVVSQYAGGDINNLSRFGALAYVVVTLYAMTITIAGVAAAPVAQPGAFALMVAGAGTWVTLARHLLSGSPAAPRPRTRLLQDLCGAIALFAVVWAPAVVVSLLSATLR